MVKQPRKEYPHNNRPEQTPEEKDAAMTKPEPKPTSLAQQLGEVMYYSSADKVAGVQFENLIPEDQEAWHSRGRLALFSIDKLNLEVLPKMNPAIARDREAKDIEIIKRVIQNFLNGFNQKKPVNPSLFPVEELALRIMRPEIYAQAPAPKSEPASVKQG